MADLTDVSSTLVGLISGIIYPNGTNNPSAAGVDAKVYAGWPIPNTLQADLKTATCNVSVYPLPQERNTTQFLQQWIEAFLNTQTLTLTASGQSVTVGGTLPAVNNPHVVSVFANGIPYPYSVQPSDTLSSIATALAALINAQVPGTSSSGPTLTLPASARLGAVRVGVTGVSVKEIARQEKPFQISVWADTPDHRKSLAQLIDPALKALTFIFLPDYTAGRIRSYATHETDNAMNQGIYRRDLLFMVDYATTQVETDYQITQIQENISSELSGQLLATLYE